jgi:hypothetical protein
MTVHEGAHSESVLAWLSRPKHGKSINFFFELLVNLPTLRTPIYRVGLPTHVFYLGRKGENIMVDDHPVLQVILRDLLT